MSTTVEQIYSKTILPLADSEKLEIASKILAEVTKKGRNGELRRKGGDISKFFGMYKGNHPDGSDNEKIDADLARAYADTHKDED
ncbi:MAG: hypothetical protein KF855_06915 [Acidobacteria bacterium]|nr:hypothetical protein [Acidobacteriota bacterium]